MKVGTYNKCDNFAIKIRHEKDEQQLTQLKMGKELHQRIDQKATDQKKMTKKNQSIVIT